MKKGPSHDFRTAICFLVGFLAWTATVRFVDLQAIGPQGSTVGLSAINRFVHDLTGVHMSLYTITDWLSLVPALFTAGLATLGLVQWIQRKNILKVDYSLLVLGGFYIVVLAVYILFEVVVINYRPVLIAGFPEASYPSSTTVLVLCVMSTAVMQLNIRIKHKLFKLCISSAITAFMIFMVIGRLISGVHWFTDIIGGALLSAGLVLLYRALIRRKNNGE